MDRLDVAIIGGGVIGCAIARALAASEPALKVAVLEKENQLALHQSGRNSGVVHVGYNQKPGTLKAKYVVEGSKRLRQYCLLRRIACVENGIVIVARTQGEEPVLEELQRRGAANGACTRLITHTELLELEPHASGISALHAPEGASLDARGFVQSLAEDARAKGVQVNPGEKVTAIDITTNGITLTTPSHTVPAKLLVNAAGLQADRIAHLFGCGGDYRIVPFRGDYFELIDSRRELIRSHLYAAPDLAFPFLGVHFSRTFDNRVIVGPGACLALGRESYGELESNWNDLAEMASFQGFWSMLGSKNMKRLAAQEWKKALFKGAVAAEGAMLLKQLSGSDLKKPPVA